MKKLFDKISDKYKEVIFSSGLVTFLTHIYFFTSRFGNEDDLHSFFVSSRVLSSGRFANGNIFTGSYALPIVYLVFVMVVMMLITLMVCEIFDVKKKYCKILIAVILPTFPALAMGFGYIFMTETYMMALLLAVLAVYLAVTFKWGFLFGSIFLAFSLGYYQAYVAVASALSILYLISLILKNANTKEIISKTLKLIFMGVLGTLLYFLILKIYLMIFDVTLSSYRGADSMGIPPLNQWYYLITRTYKEFLGYFLGISFFKFPLGIIILQFAVFAAILGIVLYFVFKKKLYKNKVNFALFIVLGLLTPLAINIVDFVAWKTNLSSLVIYSFVFVYVFVVVLIDIVSDNINKTKIHYGLLFVTVSLYIISFFNFNLINRYYEKVRTFYEYSINLNNRLLMRMEMIKGFNYNMPLMIVGDKDNDFYNILHNTEQWDDIVNYDQGLWGRFLGYEDLYSFDSEHKILLYMNNQLGFEFELVNPEQKETIKRTSDFEDMKSWPNEDSLKVIDGVMVIKF